MCAIRFTLLGAVRACRRAGLVHRRALELYQAADLRIGEAYAMAGIGSCANRLGQPDRAISSIATAMDIHAELGDAYGSAGSWQSLG
jgi:hypothetical protein